MSDGAARNALIVRGGWEGHSPEKATELFVPFLESSGYTVQVEEGPAVYARSDTMAAADLIVQCVTMSSIQREEFAGLESAVRNGAGFAGWHGGIADSYRATSDYLHLVGGQFATHPARDDLARGEHGAHTDFRDHRIQLTEAGRKHPITSGIGDFDLRTEQYWVLTDDYNDVLATTTHPTGPDRPWSRPVTCPAIWTRRWGRGRIFVATPGHDLATLRVPAVRTVIERGMLWASR